MPVSIPDYEVFKSKTSVFRDRFHRSYGTKWNAVHLAYRAYKEASSEENGQLLFTSLDTYLQEHGSGTGNFEDHERNQDDFLKKIYMDLRYEYKNLLGESRLGALEAQKAVDTLEAPHTRLGVLYALKQIDVDANFSIASTVVGALAQAGNITGNVLGADLSQLNTAKNAQFSAVIPGLSINSEDVSINSKNITTLGHMALAGGAGALGGSGNAVALETVAPDPSFQYPQTLAAIEQLGTGLLDSYAETDYFSPNMMGASYNSIIITGQVVTVGLTAAAELTRNTFSYVSAKAYKLWLTIKGKLKEYIDKLVERFSQDSQFAFQFPLSIASALLKITLKVVMGTAMPFIGNAITLAEKGVSAITNAIGAAILAYSQKNVQMNAGHPDLIAKYIIDSKWGQALSDACQAIAAAALVAVDATVPGVGSLVGAISAACQWIYGVIHQYCTVTNVKKFLDEAKAKWNEQLAYANLVAQAGAGASASKHMDFLRDTDAFTAWFEKGCKASVLIPAIVLRSGYAGSWMSWCRLVTDAATLVTQKTFDEGVAFVDKLKDEALRVVRDSTIRIIPVDADASHMVGVINGQKMIIKGYEEVDL